MIKNDMWNASLLAGQLDAKTMRLLWLLLSLTLFVLSAGAPAGDSGHIG
jgi:hypothetical protein